MMEEGAYDETLVCNSVLQLPPSEQLKLLLYSQS